MQRIEEFLTLQRRVLSGPIGKVTSPAVGAFELRGRNFSGSRWSWRAAAAILRMSSRCRAWTAHRHERAGRSPWWRITRQLNLLDQRQHVRIEPRAEQYLGLDILRGAVRFRLGENAGEAAEDLQEGGNGGVIERHVMLFHSGVIVAAEWHMPQMGSENRNNITTISGSKGRPEISSAGGGPF